MWGQAQGLGQSVTIRHLRVQHQPPREGHWKDTVHHDTRAGGSTTKRGYHKLDPNEQPAAKKDTKEALMKQRAKGPTNDHHRTSTTIFLRSEPKTMLIHSQFLYLF